MLTKEERKVWLIVFSGDGHTLFHYTCPSYNVLLNFTIKRLGSISIPSNPGLFILGMCALGVLSQQV